MNKINIQLCIKILLLNEKRKTMTVRKPVGFLWCLFCLYAWKRNQTNQKNNNKPTADYVIKK